MEMEDQSGGYHRPRRPNPDTISYLRSIPLDVKLASEEITAFLNALSEEKQEEELEYPSSLAAALSALDEIRNEVSSLAGEESAAEILEVLVHLTAPYSAVAAQVWLQAVSGYAMHLATHRYGSHVLQTILQVATKTHAASLVVDLALHPEAPPMHMQNHNPTKSEEEEEEDTSSSSLIQDLLLGIQRELAPFAPELAVHMCGSHVLRTLLCVLGGVELKEPFHASGAAAAAATEMQFFRRGKVKSKKKKKKPPSGGGESDSGGASSSLFQQTMTRIPSSQTRVPLSSPMMHQALQELTAALSGDAVQAPGDLQHWACHPSAGPLLTLLLQVLTFVQARPETEAASRSGSSHANQNHHLAIFQPVPKFEKGSAAHDLALRLLCWEESKPASEQTWARDVMYGLAGEARGSHCLETMLRYAPDAFYEDMLHVGGWIADDNSKTIRDYAEHDVSNFVLQTLLATVRCKAQADALLEALLPLVEDGYILDASKKRRGILWRMVEMTVSHKTGQDRVLESLQQGIKALKPEVPSKKYLQEVVLYLLLIGKPTRDGERLGLDVPGARTLYFMLRWEAPLCDSVADAVVAACSAEEWELLAKDGLGSRCVWEGLLHSPVVQTSKRLQGALKKVLNKLQGRWVALAVDRVGHHVVTQLFDALEDLTVRMILVEELGKGKNRLQGNSMGRAVMQACHVQEYLSQGAEAWRRHVKKAVEKQNWLRDIVQGGGGESSTVASAAKQGEEQESGGHARRKRKDVSVVDTILNAMTIPERDTGATKKHKKAKKKKTQT